MLDDPHSVALGNEPVRLGGDVVGRVTSGGYGYTVERSIAYAYLPAEVELGSEVEIDIFGTWVRRRAHARAAVRPTRRAGPGAARNRRRRVLSAVSTAGAELSPPGQSSSHRRGVMVCSAYLKTLARVLRSHDRG